MRADIVPGAVFPDYEPSDHRGKRRKLSELQQHDPMVVVLSRGAYCPKDRRQHEGLVQLHREMEVGYCRLVTISTDNLIETNEFRTGVGAHWPFLSDARRTIQKDLDIAEYTDASMMLAWDSTEPSRLINSTSVFIEPSKTILVLERAFQNITKKLIQHSGTSSQESREHWTNGLPFAT